MCPICRGRGEVDAGVTGGVVEYGPVTMGYDWRGNFVPTRPAYPTFVRPNKNALIRGEVWYLETNDARQKPSRLLMLAIGLLIGCLLRAWYGYFFQGWAIR